MKVCIHIEMFQAQDARQVFLDYSGVHSRPLSSKNASCNFLLPLLACSSGRLTRIAHITCWKQNSACITTASSMYALCPHTTPLETRPQACLWHFIVGHTTSPKLQPEDTHCHYEKRKWKKNPHNWKKKKFAHKQALLMLVMLKEPNPTLKTAKVPHSFRLHQNGLTGGR